MNDLQALYEPFGSRGHEGETDGKHYDTNPLINDGVIVF